MRPEITPRPDRPTQPEEGPTTRPINLQDMNAMTQPERDLLALQHASAGFAVLANALRSRGVRKFTMNDFLPRVRNDGGPAPDIVVEEGPG